MCPTQNDEKTAGSIYPQKNFSLQLNAYESKEETVAKHAQIRTECAELNIVKKVLPEIFS